MNAICQYPFWPRGFVGLVWLCSSVAAWSQAVSILTDAGSGAPVRYALERFEAALRTKGIAVNEVASFGAVSDREVIAAVAGKTPAFSALLKRAGAEIPAAPESLVIRKTQIEGKEVLVLAGRDERGLMYALLEAALGVSSARNSAQPFSEIRNATESPDVIERAVSIYTMQKRYFEDRLFDEDHWKRYFDMLAENRFNAFVVVFGYENGGYLAPVYPYLFDVEGFPDVQVVGFSPEQQRKYSAALHRMIELAHERGLKFTAGLWDHIYRGGVQSGGVKGADPNQKLPGVAYGLNSTNLMDYSTAAFAKFLRMYPEIDAVQFRMHNESGLKAGAEMREFWRRIYQVVKAVRPNLEFNARAKEFPDELIDMAVEMGLRLRITTKYWAEQMGMPFHPTHVNRQNQHDRRHGYADLLRYPKRYPMHWRLWNGGTTRVLLWGSPDYVRRFAESTHLYDGQGFEINEMLATKMEAQPHEAEPFELLTSKYRFYKDEFERYWHFYQVWGRVSYNPNTSPEVWNREFQRRFGGAGPHLRDALHTASWILPRINASIFPYHRFPTTRGWVEKQRWEDLPAYANAEGSDIQQFASFNEAATNQLRGTFTAKLHPRDNSTWFRTTAEGVLESVRKAESVARRPFTPEFVSTVTDLRILAHLAMYHSHRVHAALEYALFKQTKTAPNFDKAIEFETRAIESWRELVKAAGDVYAPDLMMGLRSAGLAGHWRDELVELEKGLVALKKQRTELQSGVSSGDVVASEKRTRQGSDRQPPAVSHEKVKAVRVGQPLKIVARVSDDSELHKVRVLYRGVTQHEDFRSLDMRPAGAANTYEVVIPADQIDPQWDFMYLIEAIDQHGNGKIFPDLQVECPYIVVKLERE